jgi:hypothetical protein
LERSQQGHEERHPSRRLRAGGRVRPRRAGRSPGRAVHGADGRARSIGRQLEVRHAPQPSPPVADELVEQLAPHSFPLPDRVIGVLDRQVGEGRGLPIAEGRIKHRQLADGDPEGPAVRDDVVHAEDDRVSILAHPEQPRMDQGPAGEVERPPDRLDGEPSGLDLPPVVGILRRSMICRGRTIASTGVMTWMGRPSPTRRSSARPRGDGGSRRSPARGPPRRAARRSARRRRR